LTGRVQWDEPATDTGTGAAVAAREFVASYLTAHPELNSHTSVENWRMHIEEILQLFGQPALA
jgi:hypothetical protein